ncbi:MAG: SDR family NAD(P)-dependent oxidoreductase [Deltaproteobacteria bacterium]|nr:SDR family NAD(P)-dependent oxidoreductase [Deltaproteobacteria bacterium]MBW2724729.1 SDR family NAD(P)-dependent oxidoreductase [Deltaproteobacteria bacterium]
MGSLLDRYGPCALVTGASSGIGEAFARELAKEGFDLVLVARRKERLEALAAELRASRSACENVEVLALDLTRPDFIDAIVSACEKRDIGLLVSNAGAGAKGAFDETPLDKKHALLELNCRAPMILADQFIPRFKKRGCGGLIITSSIESVVGFPYSATYAATKAFATALGEGLWGELDGSGVDILVLEPGSTDTETLALQGMNAKDMIGLMQPASVARTALDRLGRGPVVIAGRMNRLLVGLLSLLPRRIAIRAAGKGMRDAIAKGRAQP